MAVGLVAAGNRAYNHGSTGTGNAGGASGAGTVQWATGSHTINTNGAIPAGAQVYVVNFWYATPQSITGCSGGGLTWTLVQRNGANFALTVHYADAPSGLSSNTAITVTHANGGGGGMFCCYSTDLATGTVAASNASGPATNYTVGSLTTSASNGMTCLFGGSLVDGTTPRNTPTNGSTETLDFGDPGGPVLMWAQWQARASAGTYSETGTLSAGGSFNEQIGLAINGAGGGGGVTAKQLAALGVG